uniref:hypothetical protein n=1 Tax=Hyphococcus sp. TaxID=2038636 RepID=UPI0035C71DA1
MKQLVSKLWPISILVAAFTIISMVEDLKKASIYLSFALVEWRRLLHAFWEFFPNVIFESFGIAHINIPTPFPELMTLLALIILSARAGDKIKQSRIGRAIRISANSHWRHICYPVILKMMDVINEYHARVRNPTMRVRNLSITARSYFSSLFLMFVFTVLIIPYLAPYPIIFDVLLSEYMAIYEPLDPYGGPFPILFIMLLALGVCIDFYFAHRRFRKPQSLQQFEEKFLYIAGLPPGKWSDESVSFGFERGAETWRNEPSRKKLLQSCVRLRS